MHLHPQIQIPNAFPANKNSEKLAKRGMSYIQILGIYTPRNVIVRECVKNLDLRVQGHPGELWVSKQRVQKVMSQRSAGLCPRCTHANAFPDGEIIQL